MNDSEGFVLDEKKINQIFKFNKLSKKKRQELLDEVEFFLETDKRRKILYEKITQRMKKIEELKSIDNKDIIFNEKKYSKFTSMLDSKPCNTIDVDKIINAIDAKIAKLEAEGK